MVKKSLVKRPMFWVSTGLVLLGAVSVFLIIGGLLFGWVTADAGFMKYCPQKADGLVEYRYTGDGPNDIHLKEICFEDVGLDAAERPWAVSVAGGGDLSDLKEATENAVEDINSYVGCALFTVRDRDKVTVTISRQAVDSAKPHPGGFTEHRLVDGHWTVNTVIYNLVTAGDLHRALLHELGHAAGLAHDDFVDSVMYVKTNGSMYLTQEDRKRLRKRYCQ